MRRIFLLLVLVVLLAPSARAQFVAPGGTLPVVASLPGLNNTDWRTDLSIVNLGTTETSVVMLLQPEIRDGVPVFEPVASDPMVIEAGAQRTIRNVLGTVFGLGNDKKGALSIFSTDFSPLVIGARIYTLGDDGGSYGQNVEGVLVAKEAWAPGVTHDDFYRTNLGIFLPVDPLPGQTVRYTVTVRDGAGDQVGTGTVAFTEAGLQQRSLSTFGVGQLLEGYVEVSCQDQSLTWYGYISRVDQVSGDAVFRPLRGRQSDLP
jgi:hypothetical protein